MSTSSNTTLVELHNSGVEEFFLPLPASADDLVFWASGLPTDSVVTANSTGDFIVAAAPFVDEVSTVNDYNSVFENDNLVDLWVSLGGDSPSPIGSSDEEESVRYFVDSKLPCPSLSRGSDTCAGSSSL
ncbi:hypothetical protein CLU79DRAFT_722216 [Phycomyces nitens]|nr:hypothetical protein CLU79DRAFT_722216 [Phycomyces nitens]